MLKIETRTITSVDTLAIRLPMLRPGGTRDEVVFPGDDDPDTSHIGAYVNHRLVGVASLYRRGRPSTIPSACDGAPDSWQLRGMATLTDFQGLGVGRALIEACLAHIRLHGGRVVWCNARLSAVEFYRKQGFSVLGDLFDIPTVGPHYIMERLL